MKRYEVVAVTIADYPDSEIEGLIERYRRIIESRGGTVVRMEKWGRRRLAYEIKKQTKGFYFLLNFVAQPDQVEELERNFKLDDRILRFMTIKLSDEVSMEEIEQERQAAEPEPVAEPVTESAENQLVEEKEAP